MRPAPPGTDERLVVVVPCLNEEDNIDGTVASIRQVAAKLPLPVDVLMIDDGSTDRTGERIDALCARYGYRAIHNPKPLGVGRALLNAYEEIEAGSWVTIVPGDNELHFESIEAFVEMRHDYDLILGYARNPIVRPLKRRLFSSAYMNVARFLYGYNFNYLNGMKLFRVDVFRGIDVVSSGHAFNAELVAKAMLRDPHLRVGQAQFVFRGRPTGQSKAIRPASILQAVQEVYQGWQSVGDYREMVIRREDELHAQRQRELGERSRTGGATDEDL